MMGEVCLGNGFPRNGIKAFDIIAVFVLLALAACSLIIMLTRRPSDNAVAVIYFDGEEIRYPLAKDAVISVSSLGYDYTIEIKNGKVSVADAGCHDLVCKHTGPIDAPSASIICIPGRLIITVENERRADNACDIIAGH